MNQATLPKDSSSNHGIGEVALDRRICERLALPESHLPLQNYIVYDGNDLEVASRRMNTMAKMSRHFEARNSDDDLRLQLRRARLSRSQIAVTYNSHPIRLTSLYPTHLYTLVVPLSGSFDVPSHDRTTTLRPPQAYFRSANSTVSTNRSGQYVAIVLSLTPAGFERFISGEADLQAMPEQPYSIGIDMDSPELAPFCSVLGALMNVLDAPSSREANQDAVISRLEEALWYQFFVSCPSVYEAHQQSQFVVAAPAAVRKVVDYIHANIATEITMAELVELSGVSQRTLHAGFKDTYGCGPIAFVRRTKLENCRQRLLRADAAKVSVTDVAAELGFFHLSNFARYYRQEFGELPSDTLRDAGKSED